MEQKMYPLYAFMYYLFTRQCNAASDGTLVGTCFTNEECDEAGGEVDGNCASGFGVCCII